MEVKKVLIIFKTHLDIGFTDFASVVKQKYFDVFIPNAIRTASELRERKADATFKWTTGSWLISEYLREYGATEKGDALRTAILQGDICWHGLPCTTHTEIMTKELFEYGLSLSRKLDTEFGVHTIAAKMTDVPGHTKSVIPLLKKAGIELLHIGVNPASAVPDLPEIFRWQHISQSGSIHPFLPSFGIFYIRIHFPSSVVGIHVTQLELGTEHVAIHKIHIHQTADAMINHHVVATCTFAVILSVAGPDNASVHPKFPPAVAFVFLQMPLLQRKRSSVLRMMGAFRQRSLP